ncbi:hypothetical protein FOCC_FOCC002061 [Frankliniella occidentalis]|nr:hypothetical protein FOCC_FOCC002061 [Frankliniella occidentalis]
MDESENDASSSSDFHGFDVPPDPRHPIINDRDLPKARVLSMFDGIGAGRVVLRRLNIAVEKYWSLEIDENCIRVLRENHSDITHLGSVTDFQHGSVANAGRIDILLGGSPCGEISLANPFGKGLDDPTGQSYLFYDYVRVRNQLKAAADAKGQRELGCEPFQVCASRFSATKRKRLFWSNIPVIYDSLEPQGRKISLQEYLGLVRVAQVPLAKTITTNRAGQKSSSGKLPVTYEGKEEYLFARDIELLLGFPAGYTDYGGMSNSTRTALLGRSWSVDVVMAILSPLKDFFRREHQGRGLQL